MNGKKKMQTIHFALPEGVDTGHRHRIEDILRIILGQYGEVDGGSMDVATGIQHIYVYTDDVPACRHRLTNAINAMDTWKVETYPTPTEKSE